MLRTATYVFTTVLTTVFTTVFTCVFITVLVATHSNISASFNDQEYKILRTFFEEQMPGGDSEKDTERHRKTHSQSYEETF